MRSWRIGELLAFGRQLFFCKDNRKNYICSEELRVEKDARALI